MAEENIYALIDEITDTLSEDLIYIMNEYNYNFDKNIIENEIKLNNLEKEITLFTQFAKTVNI
ncbi:MAG: hypothetical protein IJX17_05560 [Clostridia bacterium]|nr:hypothetical protein [Clostridia bacterium]